MGKVRSILSLIFFLLICASSITGCGSSRWFREDNAAIADATIQRLIEAVNCGDESMILHLFSEEVQINYLSTKDVDEFLRFIRGDILSATPAQEAGIAAKYVKDKGKASKEIESAVCLTTTETAYYVALNECVKNKADRRKIGVFSIYIIEAKDWHDEYVYRGDGKWTYGININYRPERDTGDGGA